MIKELRIGNLLDADIGTVRVESILGSTFRVYCNSLDEDYLADYSVKDLKPITITEELILKFGFEKDAILYFLFAFHEGV